MTDGSRPHSGPLWLVAVVLIAVNLRPAVTSVPPLIDALSARYGLSAVAAGALTTLPVICMGLFAPLGAVAARRFGDAQVLAGSVALIAIGAGGRGVGGIAGLYLATAAAGAGIASAGAMLPSLVRARTPDRVAPVTGLYTAALIGGGFAAAAGTEPLREVLGVSAQSVLAVWALPALLALVVWLATPASGSPLASPAGSPLASRAGSSLASRAGSPPASRTGPPPAFRTDHDPEVMIGGIRRPQPHDRRDLGRMPWRSRVAWLGTLFMGMQSLLFYAALAWLAASYIELGMSARRAGLLLGVFTATQIITALAMPALAHRTNGARPWIAVSLGLTTAGLLLIGLAPTAAPWAWAALLGLGMGGNLALALIVVTEIAPSPRAASAYAGMAFFVGYLLAATGPVAAGALRDATGGFVAVYVALAGLGVATLVLGLAAARPRSSATDPATDH